MNRIVERVLLEEIAERLVADLLPKLCDLHSRRIENVCLIREYSSHEHESTDSFFDAGKDAAGVRIVAVADERDPRRVDQIAREQKIDAAPKIHHLLA